MAFIFSTSHLPEYKRPEDEEEEEEETDVQSLPRAGGVRAFSHLPQPARAQPDFSDAGRAGSPGRGIAQIPPRPATPAPPKPEDQDAPPPPEAEADHDDAPEADSSPHEPDDSRPWYMPRLSPNELTQAHGEEEPGSGLNGPGSEVWKEPTRNAGFAPSPQALRDSPSNPAPDTSRKDDPAQDNRPALPYGRLFEKRLTPGFRDQGAGQIRNGADKGELEDLVHRTQGQSTPKPQFSDLVYRSKANPEDEQDHRSGFFQNVADTRAAQRAPSRPQAPQTFAQNVRPAAQPTQKGGQTTAAAPPPAGGNAKDTPPTFKVDPADESKKNFMLRIPETQEKHPSDRAFGDHVRSIMQDELDKSPTARKLLEHIARMTGKPVIIQILTDPRDTAHPVYRSDGSIAIAINPTDLRSGTLSHEITHVIQRWASEQALKWAKEQDPEIIKATPPGQEVKLMSKNTQAINSKAREILHSIMPVTYDAERNNGTQDYIENEAMRASHIVNAEISAVNLKAELEAMKNSPNQRDRDHYEWLIKHPANIAEKFWAHQLPMEQAVHATNQGRPIPKGTRYRDYDYVYAKVLDILNSPDTPKEQRVTADHLKWERFHKVKDN